MADYDLVVIGSGPAGEKGAVQAAYFGKKVAVVEREAELGGACVNTGTLPSKTLRESSLYLSGFRQRGLHGVQVHLEREATVADLLHREHAVRADEHQRIADNLERHQVALLRGEASFADPHTVVVRRAGWPEQRLTADYVLIATGSRPHRPELYPFIHTHVFDSDEIVRIDFIPRSMAVVGAGVIGCEYACLFATLGVKVTLIESRGTLLPFLDGQMSSLLAERMAALGIELKMNETVERLTALPRSVLMGLKSSTSDFEADIVLVAAGRSSNTDMLKLEAAGITAGKRGQLDVDAHYRTQVKHIFAAGDVIGFPALASTSMEQARVAVNAMFDLKYKDALAPILPYGIYTIPEISMAGETEESLKAAKVPYVTGVASFKDNARGKIIGEDGVLKLLFHQQTMKLLGVHIIGEGATELVHVGLTAMLQGAGADLFIRMCFNYPTLSESYKYATYDALGKVRS